MRLEIGSGENPDLSYDIHCDILPLPHVEHVTKMHQLPFPDETFDKLRANDVAEHQSWTLIRSTFQEWARVLKPGGEAYIQVPDMRYIATQWLKGALSTEKFNYWAAGGHTDRVAHRGVDKHGVETWRYNSHNTFFDEAWLTELLTEAGFVDIRIQSDGGSNLMCWCTKGGA